MSVTARLRRVRRGVSPGMARFSVEFRNETSQRLLVRQPQVLGLTITSETGRVDWFTRLVGGERVDCFVLNPGVVVSFSLPEFSWAGHPADAPDDPHKSTWFLTLEKGRTYQVRFEHSWTGQGYVDLDGVERQASWLMARVLTDTVTSNTLEWVPG
jgi:hypothetical protein